MRDNGSRKTTQKVLLSVTALAAAAGLAGVGTYANFTGSTSASQQVSTGTMQITLGATGTSANRLDVSAVAMAPNDWMERAVDLNISGDVAMTAVSLTTTDNNLPAPTVLSTDASNGLQILIERCPVAWNETPVGAGFTYTCPGVTTTVLASSRVTGLDRPLGGLSLAAGDSNKLRVKISLPGSAGDTFQDLDATISHTFTGTQRVGEAK